MSQAPVPAAWVALAHEMADTARAIVLRHYRAGLHVEMKSDASPVTALVIPGPAVVMMTPGVPVARA